MLKHSRKIDRLNELGGGLYIEVVGEFEDGEDIDVVGSSCDPYTDLGNNNVESAVGLIIALGNSYTLFF